MGSSVRPVRPPDDLDAEIQRQLSQAQSGAPKGDDLDAEIQRQLAASKPAQVSTTPSIRDVPKRSPLKMTPEEMMTSALSPLPTSLIPGANKAIAHSLSHPFETLLNLGQGVMGGKRAQALLGSGPLEGRKGMDVTPGLTYDESLAAIDDATKDTPFLSRIATKIPGAVATGSLLPAVQGWKAISGMGAGLSAADRLLAAKPEPIVDRLKGTAVAGGVGAVAAPLVAKGLDLGNAAIASRSVPKIDANIVDRTAERAAESGPLYDQVRALGDVGRTPKLDALLGTGQSDGLPIIRRAIEAVKGESPTLAGLPDTDARVLAAAYKRVGSKAFAAAHGFEPGEARAAFADAIDEATGGLFGKANATFREASQGITNVQRGQAALVNSTRRVPAKQVATLSPAAFKEWAANATPEELADAGQGVAGELRNSGLFARFGLKGGIPAPLPSAALRAAPDLLNATGRGVNPLLTRAALADILASLQRR